MENDQLDVFVGDLMKEMSGVSELEPEVCQQIKSDLLERAENIINRELMNALSTQKLAEFNSMLDKDLSEEEYQSFLAANIENIDEIVINALLELKSNFIKHEIG